MKSSRSSLHSLVDRGSNGRVEGRDATVIETHPDCKFDIRGMDNHETTEIPLVTARGVKSTIPGEVVVSMHQHKFHGKKKNQFLSSDRVLQKHSR